MQAYSKDFGGKMTLKRVLAMAIVATSFADAGAQSGTNVRVPSEFPPASYTGRQYVDSKGCVYIRAGIDGQTTWVPRLSRGRKVVCGFQPSLATPTAQPSAQPAPRQAASAPPPVQITVAPEARPEQSASREAASARPATTTTERRSAPAPQPQPRVVRRSPESTPAVTRPAPQKTQPSATPAPRKQASGAKTVRVRQAAPQVAQGQPACEGASPISAQYLRAKPGMAVRCGPQAQPHSTVISGGGGAGPAMRTVRSTPAPVIRQPATQSVRAPESAPRRVVTSQTRVAPKHVYRNQVNTTAGISVPPGYQPVWEDDRLNPERAHQTFAGMAHTDVVWTKTVPRRLIERSTGREVTYRYPGLQYPYTSFEQQRDAGVTVATRGVVMQEPVSVTRTRDGQIRRMAQAPAASQPQAAIRRTAAPTVSTRSAPKSAAQAASHRYVQVGIFADAAHGKRAARSLAQKGLPAKTGTLNRNGQPYTLVVAGPFRTQAQLQSALSQARAAGYGGAKLRK